MSVLIFQGIYGECNFPGFSPDSLSRNIAGLVPRQRIAANWCWSAKTSK